MAPKYKVLNRKSDYFISRKKRDELQEDIEEISDRGPRSLLCGGLRKWEAVLCRGVSQSCPGSWGVGVVPGLFREKAT